MDSEEQKLQEIASGFTCEICIEPVCSHKRFNNNNESCSHDSYCLDCIAKYIEAQLDEYNTADIRCPGLECKELLNPLACRSILSARVFERWCDSLSESVVSRKGCYRSYCPYPDCSTGFFAECKNVIMARCSKCKRKFCFKCKVPWDSDHRCDQYTDREGIDDALLGGLVADKKWGRCPACGYVVERRSGCKHMQCRCGTAFGYKSGRIEYDYTCDCAECRAKDCICCSAIILFLLIVLFLVFGCYMIAQKM